MSRYWGKTTMQCAACKRVLGHQHHSARYCLPCADSVMDMQKAIAKSLRFAINAGKLKDWRGQKCHFCGEAASGYEHRDYSRPFNVRPICRSCNWKLGPAGKFPERAAA